MITSDTETTDLRASPPETAGAPGTAVRLADLFQSPTGAAPPVRLRVWRLYLAGGALAFEDGRMGVDQISAVRADGMDL